MDEVLFLVTQYCYCSFFTDREFCATAKIEMENIHIKETNKKYIQKDNQTAINVQEKKTATKTKESMQAVHEDKMQ